MICIFFADFSTCKINFDLYIPNTNNLKIIQTWIIIIPGKYNSSVFNQQKVYYNYKYNTVLP